jgi:ribose transport system permease protein
VKAKPAILFFVAFVLLSMIFVRNFAKPINLLNIVTQSADIILLSCGMTFVFINGSIDFSMTAILGLSSIFGAMILKSGDNLVLLIPLAIIIMLATGIAIGLINGLAVTKLKIPSFIATMATQLVFSGLALTITQSKSIGRIPETFNMISQGKILGIPTPIFYMTAVVIICVYLLNYTVFGRRIIAVGTNQKTARISGIPVEKTIISVFCISGFLSALASIVMTARLGAGLPALGKDMLMDIVAAVVIGGTAVTGGKGDHIGTAIAAIFVITLNNSLNLLQMEWFFINVCKGALILAVALYIERSA